MGIGALYYGLPQARYRLKLLENTEVAFEIQEKDIGSQDQVKDLLFRDSKEEA